MKATSPESRRPGRTLQSKGRSRVHRKSGQRPMDAPISAINQADQELAPASHAESPLPSSVSAGITPHQDSGNHHFYRSLHKVICGFRVSGKNTGQLSRLSTLPRTILWLCSKSEEKVVKPMHQRHRCTSKGAWATMNGTTLRPSEAGGTTTMRYGDCWIKVYRIRQRSGR